MTIIKILNRILLFAVSCVPFTNCQSQDTGILFEQNSNWTAILAKAKVENKYIFVDCFTTWCGPCKYMSKEIFSLEKVGDFYNEKYINVKFQFDSTINDLRAVKNQYIDANYLKKKYEIKIYPTYLFFNSDGELVQSEFGSSNANEFIFKGTNALDSNKQYFTQVKKYDAGKRDTQFLKKLSLLALRSQQANATAKFANAYISLIPQITENKEDLKFVFEI